LLARLLSSNKVAGMERSDSCAFNPHKMLGAPLQAACFLTTHRGSLKAANAAHAAYLFQPDKNFPELDMGDLTIQCGRHADAVKVGHGVSYVLSL
jgi:glutamate/tyrosine decarboxylase-like PLP-dependent enzyme